MPGKVAAYSFLTGAGKPLPVQELLKSLQALHADLREREQEDADETELQALAKPLATPALLAHKNRGVQAYACCCIADILRLAAPNAPFAQAQMKSVFDAFVRLLAVVGDTADPYHAQAAYLLESLDTVESIVLLCDLGDKYDALGALVFRTFFDAASAELRKNIEAHMVGLMRQLIDEAPHVPDAILDILLAQFMRPSRELELGRAGRSTAYEMASAVCSACSDNLQAKICQYFTDIVANAIDRSKDGDVGAATAGSELRELEKAHELMLQLWIAAPAVLQNVVPLLQPELEISDANIRAIAVQTVGLMLASPNGPLLRKQHTPTWNTWVNRRNDKQAGVRLKWVEAIGQIINSPAGSVRDGEVERMCIDAFTTKFLDHDERVRAATCRVVEGLDYETVKARLPARVIGQYAQRCRDRKATAQTAAFHHIGKLYDAAFSELLDEDPVAVDKFAKIPDAVVGCYYVNDKALTVLVERTLMQDILKEAAEDAERADRLLLVCKLLDDRNRSALLAHLGKRQKYVASLLARWTAIADKYDGGRIADGKDKFRKALGDVATALASLVADTENAHAVFVKLGEANDKRLYKLVNECIDVEADVKAVRRAVKEVHRRVQSHSGGELVQDVLRKGAMLIFNKSIVAHINVAVRDDRHGFAGVGQQLLQAITDAHPSIVKAHVDELFGQLRTKPLALSRQTLKAIASFCRAFPKDVHVDDDMRASLQVIMREATPDKVKQATTIFVAASGDVAATVDRIVDNIAFGSDGFLAELTVLAQISLLKGDAVDRRNAELQSFCLHEILLKNRTDSADVADNWDDEAGLDLECRAKVLAIRVLCNRLRYYGTSSDAAAIAAPVFKLLRRLALTMGELSPDDLTPEHHKTRLRLEAARYVCKLATTYDALVSPADFVTLAVISQDPELQVRRRFLHRLYKSLRGSMPPRYNAILFLAAHDPSAGIRQDGIRWAHALANEHRPAFLMEQMCPRLISLLAHHPDFLTPDRDDEDVENFAIYFSYYFEAVVTADTLPLVFHYAQRIKQVGDRVHDDDAQDVNLHTMAEIAQLTFRTRAEALNWPLQSYPKVLKLPQDLFRALPAERATEAQNTVLLTSEQQARIKARVLKVASKHRNLLHATPAPLVAAREDGQLDSLAAARGQATTSTPLKRSNPKEAAAVRRSAKKRRRREKADKAILANPPQRRHSGRNTTRVQYNVDADSSDEESADERQGSSDEDDLD